MAFKRFIAAFDIHGDQRHDATINCMLRFDREFKPHERVIGGDIWDMRPLRTKASTEEKRESLKADFEAGFAFLKEWTPNAITLGNHDKRLWEAAAIKNGPASDLAREYVEQVNAFTGKNRITVLPWHKREGVYRMGPGCVAHGFYAGNTATRKMAEIYGPVLFGHIHAAEHCILPSLNGRKEAWSAPCMCKPDMTYNEATPSTLRYDTGFAYGVYDDRNFHVQIAKVIDGKMIVSTELKAFAA